MNVLESIAPISSVTQQASPGAPQPSSFADLRSEDFFKLLITQITNQDPLKPTGNEELLKQISSIRDIELSTTLTDSLRSLTGQQRFGAATGLIGQYVTGAAEAGQEAPAGLVVGIRFDTNSQPILQLGNGSELPLEKLITIQAPMQAAQALVGQYVVGVDLRDRDKLETREGQVSGVRMDPQDEVVLELDTGADLRLRDVIGVVTSPPS